MPTATAAMQRVHMRALLLVHFIMPASRLHLGMVGPVHGCIQNLPATSHHVLAHATTCGLLTEARNMLHLSMLFGSPHMSHLHHQQMGAVHSNYMQPAGGHSTPVKSVPAVQKPHIWIQTALLRHHHMILGPGTALSSWRKLWQASELLGLSFLEMDWFTKLVLGRYASCTTTSILHIANCCDVLHQLPLPGCT